MHGKTMALWVVALAGITAVTGCDALQKLNVDIPGSAKTDTPAPAPAKPVYQLPFGVKVGGQDARVVGNKDVFARIADPVPANAPVEVVLQTKQVIINAFPCDDKGNAAQGAQPAVVIIKGNKGSLDRTMDKKKLAPGTYVMNVVANSKTSRVWFVVK
jgi:hypothetical protein